MKKFYTGCNVMVEGEAIKFLIKEITKSLNELYSIDSGDDEFLLGLKYAYVECLEIIQFCMPEKYKPDYKIEDKFPL